MHVFSTGRLDGIDRCGREDSATHMGPLTSGVVGAWDGGGGGGGSRCLLSLSLKLMS